MRSSCKQPSSSGWRCQRRAREEIGAEHATLIIVVEGRCKVTTEGGERDLLTGDYVLLLTSGGLT